MFKVEDIDVGKVLRIFGSSGILVRVVDDWRVYSVFGVQNRYYESWECWECWEGSVFGIENNVIAVKGDVVSLGVIK